VPNFRFTLEYDGAAFHGWQVQPGARRTVQGEFESAIARVTGQRLRVAAAGRTDVGVHAIGQVASARIDTALASDVLRRALNHVLPRDLAVVGADAAPDDFHARHSARGKLYRYRVWNCATRSPLRAARSYWVPGALDLPAIAKAAQAFLGRHDFAAFQAAGSEIESTTRTLERLDVTASEPGEIVFWVQGDGFLRHMVRNLVGTLLEVGHGRRASDSMSDLLAARDRRLAGPTAPASALTLVEVYY
jgi:tRNA pseudouridine38-40 synthase